MAVPICLVASTGGSTPAPDYRGVYFKTKDLLSAVNVYKLNQADYYLWYDGSNYIINTTAGTKPGAYFTSATQTGTFTAAGGASGEISVAEGEDYRIYLKEKDCVMVSVGLAGIPRTKQLTRRWDKISDKVTQDCMDLLYAWTSAENWQEQYYVDSPLAVGPRGEQDWPGRWRQVVVSRTRDEPDGITEILRLGFQQYTGTPSDPIDEAEARLGLEMGNVVTGDRVYRQDWRYVDPADHKIIVEKLVAIKTRTNPVVEGVAITGKFACSKIKAEPNEDGSIVISRTLTEIHSITAAGSPGAPTDLVALLPVITQEQELLNLFGFEPGDEEKLAYVYTNIDPAAATQTVCMETLLITDLEAIVGGTWNMVDRKFVEDPETGTATFAVLYIDETWLADYVADRNVIRGGTVSGWLRNLVLQATGEDQAQALDDFQLVMDELGGNFAAGTQYNKGDTVTYSATQYIFIAKHLGAWSASDVVEAHYLLNGRQLQHKGKGEYVVTGEMVSAYDGTAASDAIVVRAGDAFTVSDRRIGVRVWFRRSEAAKDTIVDPSGPGEAWTDWSYDSVTFYSHNFAVEDHQNGTFTIRQYGWALTDSEDDGFVTRIKPGITTSDQQMIIRTWPNVTQAIMLSLTDWDGGKARSNFSFVDPVFQSSTLFTHADCFIEDKTEAGYTVRQVLVFLETGVTEGDALVLHIKPSVTAEQQNIMVRIWPTVSEATKDTLVGGQGNARSAYTPPAFSAGTNYKNGDAVTYSATDYIFIVDHPAGAWDAADAIASAYVHADVFVDDRGRAGYTVRQVLVALSTAVTDAAALIIRVKSDNTGAPPILQRVWLHRTEAAKDTLMTASTGKARINYTFEGLEYWHSDALVDEVGNAGYNVRQVLVGYGSGYASAGSQWDLDYTIYKTFTRTRDNFVKEIAYQKYVAMRVSEKGAWDAIDDLATSPGGMVAGSDHVAHTGKGQFRASALSLTSVTDWQA